MCTASRENVWQQVGLRVRTFSCVLLHVKDVCQQVVLRVKHFPCVLLHVEDVCQQVVLRVKYIFMCTASRWRCMPTGSFKS